MVGVPGKSGGCATCRRRKKGCDKQRPFCGQCVDAGLVCEGYTQHSVWINSTGSEMQKYTKASSLAQARRSATPTITEDESLARVAREDRYVGLYLAAYLPNGRHFSHDASQVSTAGWLRHHDDLCRSEKTLRLVTLAHGLSMLATRNEDSEMKAKGFQAYRMAVQEMRTAVQSRRRATGDGLLAAVRLFRFYEILYGADSGNLSSEDPTSQVQGFYAHTEGEMALFMHRGCYEKWTEPGRYLLADGRIVSFILGANRRKRSPFSEPGWMTAPWKDTIKSSLDKLTDVMIQIPGLLEELDTIRASADSKKVRKFRHDLLNRCWGLDQALRAWQKQMGDTLRTYDYARSEDVPPKPRVDKDFALLHLSLLYWSSCLLLYTTVYLASSESAPLPSHNSPRSQICFSSPGYPGYQNERNPTLHAHRIIHAVPLAYVPHAGGYGALTSTFPLGLALRYLVVADLFPHEGSAGSPGKEGAFLQETLSQPFMVAYGGRFLDNLQKVDTSSSDLKKMIGWSGVELRARKFWFGDEEGKLKANNNAGECPE